MTKAQSNPKRHKSVSVPLDPEEAVLTDAQTDQWVKQNEKALRAKLRDSEADVRAGRVTRFDPADPLAALRLGRAGRLRHVRAK